MIVTFIIQSLKSSNIPSPPVHAWDTLWKYQVFYYLLVYCWLHIIMVLLLVEQYKLLDSLVRTVRNDFVGYSVFGVYGHITLKIPVLVRSLKSSNVEPG